MSLMTEKPAPGRRSSGSPSLQAIADAAGVSPATVSMALANNAQINSQTRERIRALSRAMGYQRRPRSKARASAGESAVMRLGYFLIGGDLGDEAHSSLLAGLNHAARAYRARLEVRSVHTEDRGAAIDSALDYSHSLDGMILSGQVDQRLMDELETVGMPHVVIGHTMGSARQLTGRLGQIVTCDETSMAGAAVDLLRQRGHRRLGFVCEALLPGLWNDMWLRGFRHALLAADLPMERAWIQVSQKSHSGGAFAAQALAGLEERPTAYVVPDIRVAASFAAAMAQLQIPVDPAALIISGNRRLRARYEVEQHPWISYDDAQVAMVALRQLRQLCAAPMPCVTQVIVPFAVENAPELASPATAASAGR